MDNSRVWVRALFLLLLQMFLCVLGTDRVVLNKLLILGIYVINELGVDVVHNGRVKFGCVCNQSEMNAIDNFGV